MELMRRKTKTDRCQADTPRRLINAGKTKNQKCLRTGARWGAPSV